KIVDWKVKQQENNCAQAIDVAIKIDQSTFRCFAQQGLTVAFIRVYESNGNGAPDVNCIANIYNAANEGLGIEIYVEPQPYCTKKGSAQFMEMYTYLTSRKIAVGAIWIKITKPIIWLNNHVANTNFINEFITCAWRHGVTVGIFTNWYDWQQITSGQLTSDQTQIRLWYWNMLGAGANAATLPTFDDFRAFGGFNVPSAKQYVQNTYICGICTSLSIYVNQMLMDTSLSISINGKLKTANITPSYLSPMLPIMAKVSEKQVENEHLKKKEKNGNDISSPAL
uniref:Lysozyme n=1 Tax=Elaeophora elaphi TaxID=1147741 RepID=A0A0R3RS46_9BILA